MITWWKRRQAARLIRKTLKLRKMSLRQTYVIGRFAIDDSEFRGKPVPDEIRAAVALLAED